MSKGTCAVRSSLGTLTAALQALDEPDLLNVEILLRELEFFGQGHFLTVGVVEETAHEVAQANDHVDGCVISLFANQPGDGVQRVEQEVRFDLPAKRAELCFDELLVEARGFGLLRGEAFTGVEQVPDQQDGGVEDKGGEKSVVELLGGKMPEGHGASAVRQMGSEGFRVWCSRGRTRGRW